MARSIERYLRNLPRAQGVRCTERVWYPPADVYQTGDGWIVKVELAGIQLDEIEITLESHVMRLTGSRRDTMCLESISYQQLEITYSSFEKVIRFPCRIEGAAVKTVYRDGLLIISLSELGECT